MAIRFKESLNRIAGDLFTIEVNTILTDNISAVKVPPPEEALQSIATDYSQWLGSSRGRVAGPHQESTRSDLQTMSFANIHSASHTMAETGPPDMTGDEKAVLQRIERNSKRIHEMLGEPAFQASRAAGAESVTSSDKISDKNSARTYQPDEIVEIRKMWEIGTNTVLMQSVVQVDGDVVMRIRKGFESDAHASVHKLHGQAVDRALSHWEFLVKTLTSFVSGTIGSLFGGKP